MECSDMSVHTVQIYNDDFTFFFSILNLKNIYFTPQQARCSQDYQAFFLSSINKQYLYSFLWKLHCYNHDFFFTIKCTLHYVHLRIFYPGWWTTCKNTCFGEKSTFGHLTLFFTNSWSDARKYWPSFGHRGHVQECIHPTNAWFKYIVTTWKMISLFFTFSPMWTIFMTLNDGLCFLLNNI